MPHLRTNHFARVAGVAFVVALETVALADEPKSARGAAAQAFDEAVKKFEHADYEGAAREFLHADELAPSADALHNAIAAARKANAHLLVATAAERAIERPNEREELVTEAREALVVAAPKLAHIDLGCAPLPCTLLLDGSPVPAGRRYALPGAYSAVTVAEDGNRTEERLTLAAGVTYSVLIHATKAGESKKAATVSTKLTSEAPESAPKGEPSAGAAASRPARPSAADEKSPAERKPLSPAVFYAGAGLTAVLVGINVWSGVDTLNAKSDLPSPPTTKERDDVRSKETRSDVIFGATLLVGAATAAAGLFWVDWGGGGTALVSPIPGGATAVARGRF